MLRNPRENSLTSLDGAILQEDKELGTTNKAYFPTAKTSSPTNLVVNVIVR
jgi:hypothetical protein